TQRTSSTNKSSPAFRPATFPIRRSSRLIPYRRRLPRLQGAGCREAGGRHRNRRRTDRKARARSKGGRNPGCPLKPDLWWLPFIAVYDETRLKVPGNPASSGEKPPIT